MPHPWTPGAVKRGAGPERGRVAARSGAVGSALEFYDFFIYTQAAAIIFPELFFPSADPAQAIIASLGTFGVGYVARPVGAFVLGGLGDRVGRRFTLILTMALMGASTFAVGLLPGYGRIGIAAPLLLVLCRLVQGFAVAGEISGSSTLIIEQTPLGVRGSRASVTLQGAQIGQIFGALVFIPLSALLPAGAFRAWGWRLPFLLSALLIVVGFSVRLRTVESRPADAPAVPPIRRVLSQNPGTVLRVFAMSLTNIVPVTATVFGASLATQRAYGIGWLASVYLWIPVLGNCVAVLVIPVAARLSDRLGRRPLVIGGALSSGAFSFLYLWAITQGILWLTICSALLMWGTLYQGYNAVFPAFFPEQFPASTRVTGMAIGQNIGTAASSLMAMVFAAVCPPGTRTVMIVLVVGAMTLGITGLAALAAALSPETSRIPGDRLGSSEAVPLDEQEYASLRADNLFGPRVPRHGTD
ncbi:MFS transporter [uncultured Propionibacterium sp.]|uniref:MFS transporter n=1 Tax=uncultured Propionibacterium sp. TaxID=218066 RepID=UPI00292D1F52|nr:MFS transporter [uncultured Propionibacterium sp.]